MQYLHKLFEEEPRHFYRLNVYAIILTNEEEKIKVIEENSNVATKIRVRKYLQTLKKYSIIETMRNECITRQASYDYRLIYSTRTSKLPNRRSQSGIYLRRSYWPGMGELRIN